MEQTCVDLYIIIIIHIAMTRDIFLFFYKLAKAGRYLITSHDYDDYLNVYDKR